jgi:hypothetical protein
MTNPPVFDARTRTLGIIRMSFLAGVLLFGAVVWFLHRQPGYVVDGSMEPLRPVMPFVLLTFIAAIVAVRVYLSRITDELQLNNFRLIGWAIGEAAALCGGVFYFNTNDPRFFIMGLFVQLASFVVVPLRRS